MRLYRLLYQIDSQTVSKKNALPWNLEERNATHFGNYLGRGGTSLPIICIFMSIPALGRPLQKEEEETQGVDPAHTYQ